MSETHTAEELARAVMAWARESRNHGANPYTLDMVKIADNIQAAAIMWPSVKDNYRD